MSDDDPRVPEALTPGAFALLRIGTGLLLACGFAASLATWASWTAWASWAGFASSLALVGGVVRRPAALVCLVCWLLHAPSGLTDIGASLSLAGFVLAGPGEPLSLASSSEPWRENYARQAFAFGGVTAALGLIAGLVGPQFVCHPLSLVIAALLLVDRRTVPPVQVTADRMIVFFDGVCGLCNRTVDILLAEDADRRFLFAPLQGEAGQRIDDPKVQAGESMAFMEGERLYAESEAILRIGEHLGGVWRLASLARILPLGFRQWCYDQLQRRRYDIFGKLDACRMPTPDERSRFID